MDIQLASDFIAKRKAKIRNGLSVKMKDIGRETQRSFVIEESAFLICKHLNSEQQPFKIFVFERLKANRPEGKVAYDVWEAEENTQHPNIEYRFGYYIVGKIGNKKGRWTWGQYCPMIGHSDFNALIELARNEGIIL